MPQNFWNRVNPPSPPPFNVQKRVKIGENKSTSKLLDYGLTPPPFWTMSERKVLFFWWLPWVKHLVGHNPPADNLDSASPPRRQELVESVYRPHGAVRGLYRLTIPPPRPSPCHPDTPSVDLHLEKSPHFVGHLISWKQPGSVSAWERGCVIVWILTGINIYLQ